MRQTFEINGILPSMNEIIAASKKHWSKYAKPKKSYDIIVSAYARQQLKPITKYPVDIACVWYCKDKRKDPDGVSAGIKFILDGLVKAKIIKSDGFKQIRSITHLFEVDRQKPRVVVTLSC